MIKQYLIDRIEEKYNPEFDVPAEPQVTWVDAYLLEIIKAQQSQIEKLQSDVNYLRAAIDRVRVDDVEEAEAMFKQHQQMKEAMNR